jgi:hypothetical protein
MIAIRKILFYFFINALILLFGTKSFSCTIFYLKNDTIILAGNNEDWKDPNSKMWFYPAANDKHGWIKFGLGSGFPQGGMNDQGVFWDATSGPYLEMPYSEAYKELYQGPLMKKIIEECASIEDATTVFSNYYCTDQYRAQYLVGDAKFNSIIVEGDSIISMQDGHLILTNFYHSHPQLGGYPCWRYDIALDMITGSEDYTTYLVGSILSATHQEGKYPTQYSQIYDLINCRIYLFYYHNYEEFVLIDLQEELKKGYRSFDIPALFARIKMLSPYSGEKISSTSVAFTWEGKPGYNYELMFSTDPEFNECKSETFTTGRQSLNSNLTAVLLLAGLLLIIPKNKSPMLRRQILMFLFLGVLGLHCQKDDNTEEEDQVVVMNQTIENLLPNTTYYWKIKSNPISQHDFQSETVTKHFITGNPVGKS